MEYRVLSRYRSELMGIAMLWVMCFHAFDLDLGSKFLNFVRAIGFGGVDIFILLSAMSLVMSLEKRPVEYGAFLRRRAGRILPAYYGVVIPYTVFQVLVYGARPGRPQPLRGTKGKRKGARLWYVGGQQF